MAVTQVVDEQISHLRELVFFLESALRVLRQSGEAVLVQADELNVANDPRSQSAWGVTFVVARLAVIRSGLLLEDVFADDADGGFLVGRGREQDDERRIRSLFEFLGLDLGNGARAGVESDLYPGELTLAHRVDQIVNDFDVDAPDITVCGAVVREFEGRNEKLKKLIVELVALMLARCEVAKAAREEVVLVGTLRRPGRRFTSIRDGWCHGCGESASSIFLVVCR